MKRSIAACSLVWFLLIAPSARAQVPPVPDIPKQVIVPGDRPRLERLRSELVQQLVALQANAAALKAKCTGVENGTSLYDECAGDQSKVQAEKQAYIDAVDDFKKKLEPPPPLPEHVAAVASIKGEVHIITANGADTLVSGGTPVPLDGHPRITTGPDGHLQLLLPDETVFTLGPDSDMVIDEFVYDPATSATKATAKFAKGVFRWVTGKVQKKDIKFDFPILNLGIRGTDLEAMVKTSGAGYVKLFEGQVDLTEKKKGAKVTLNAGQKISFTADGTLSQPVPLDEGISRAGSTGRRISASPKRSVNPRSVALALAIF